jgi:hypothetical protein
MEINLQKQEIRGRRQDMRNPAFGNGKPFGRGRMGNLIQNGTLLIKQNTVVPESITFESRPCLKGWNIVQGLSASGLDRRLNEVGWNLVYLGTEISASAWGWDEAKATLKAVRRLLRRKDANNFNCLHITETYVRRWLGVARVCVVAHWRQMQKGPVLFQA